MQIQRRGPEPRAVTFGLRSVGIAVAGFSVLALGLILLVVPVPGTSVVIFPLGLAILAREFRWAQRLLNQSIAVVRSVGARARRLFGRPSVIPTAFPLPLRP